MTIKDIYSGKLDAKDEFLINGSTQFSTNYIVPEKFNFDELIDGTGYFITGSKGAGKTAVLLYLAEYLKSVNPRTFSSKIFFKTDYPQKQREELETMAGSITSLISIDRDVMLTGNDYGLIWKWILFTRMVDDNAENNGDLFVDNEDWSFFRDRIEKMRPSKNETRFFRLPQTIQVSPSISDPATQMLYATSFQVDFGSDNLTQTNQFKGFTEAINRAEYFFGRLKRTETPYYIFIDELEAYYGDQKVFLRDLRMVRDLIFTVKDLNLSFFKDKDTKTKIICSIRTEVLNAIYRNITDFELNKAMGGFEVPLNWDYNNTNSFSHPILKILVKRIQYGEGLPDSDTVFNDIVRQWFPEKIDNKAAASYILDNTWSKPRDIVTFISAAKEGCSVDSTAFTQDTIYKFSKIYSNKCLTEIREELGASYSAKEIDLIVGCLTGYKTNFTFPEISERVRTKYPNSIFDHETVEVINTLYRVGAIGNYKRKGGSYRWQHRGDSSIILDDDWSIYVHPALWRALSLKNRKEIREQNKVLPGDRVSVTIERIKEDYALGTFTRFGKQKAIIYFNKRKSSTSKDIRSSLKKGSTVQGQVREYNDRFHDWIVDLTDRY